MADDMKIRRSMIDGPCCKAGQTDVGLERIAGQLAGTVCGLLLAVCCHAEDLPDPTRPPAAIYMPEPGTETVKAAKENPSAGLHSVFISETRRAAIIDGQTVELGGEFGGAKLVEVNEGGVVLQRAHGRQVLTLFPEVKIIRKEAADTGSKAKRPLPASPRQPSGD